MKSNAGVSLQCEKNNLQKIQILSQFILLSDLLMKKMNFLALERPK